MPMAILSKKLEVGGAVETARIGGEEETSGPADDGPQDDEGDYGHPTGGGPSPGELVVD